MAGLWQAVVKSGPVFLGLVALALVVLLQLAGPAPLDRVRLQVFDAYQRAAPRVAQDSGRVAIVDIDEASIERLGQWPWPRDELAELTRRLGAAGASAVAFDIVFSEPDRTSPAAIAARYRESGRGDVPPAFANMPGHDALLAQGFAEVPVVAGFFLDRQRRGREFEPKAGFSLHGSLPARDVPSYEGALLPLPELEASAAGVGFVSLENDADGIVRRAPLAAIYRGRLIPSLSLEAVRVASGAGSPALLASDGSGQNASAPGAAVSVRLGDTEIPLTRAGEMWVHFPAAETHQAIPAWSIITGDLADARLAQLVAGRIVFIGGSAAGLQDLVSTPLSERTAGVTVHAAAVEQMLAGDSLERPDWAPGLELVLVLLLGGALAFVLPRLGAAFGALAALAGTALVAGLSWLAFTRAGYLLDPTYPVLAIGAIYLVQTVAVFYREERQRSYIHAAFDRYLSPELVRRIAADPTRLELGGEEKDMSVLMCDIRGFSRISERLSPKQVIDFLIAFLTPLSDILLARRATLDKYIGDAILAFWNAPVDDPDHERNAARAALEMVAMAAQLNRDPPQGDGLVWPGEVRIGIGINAGTCCVGNMGSRRRLAYSLIGDTVNVASRLEGLTKLYGVPIAVGETLGRRLPDFALLELDRVRVVGRDAPATIFALLGDEGVAAGEPFRQLREGHLAMLAAYRATDWDAAEAALARIRTEYDSFGISGLGALFASRIAACREAPPGAGWDGTWQATEK